MRKDPFQFRILKSFTILGWTPFLWEFNPLQKRKGGGGGWTAGINSIVFRARRGSISQPPRTNTWTADWTSRLTAAVWLLAKQKGESEYKIWHRIICRVFLVTVATTCSRMRRGEARIRWFWSRSRAVFVGSFWRCENIVYRCRWEAAKRVRFSFVKRKRIWAGSRLEWAGNCWDWKKGNLAN